jgi:hypothetical protein
VRIGFEELVVVLGLKRLIGANGFQEQVWRREIGFVL